MGDGTPGDGIHDSPRAGRRIDSTPNPVPAVIRPSILLLAASLVLFAQPLSAVQEPDRLEGRLLIGDQPADTGTVVLHSVSPEVAGAVDSVQVDAGGRFVFDLSEAPTPGGGSSLFASYRHEGILYFGPALFDLEEIPERYDIRAWPTREAPAEGIELPVELRTVIIEDGPGVWRVTDLIEVHSEASETWIPGDPSAAVWRYPLPPAATDFRIIEGELAQGDLAFEEQTLVVRGALQPGHRVFVIQYDLESLAFSLPLTGRTDAMELLVEEPVPPLQVDGLVATGPVRFNDGPTYARWEGEALSNRVIRTTLGPASSGSVAAWLGIGIALLLIVVGAFWVRQGEGGAGKGP